MPRETKQASNVELLDSFYRVFLILGTAFLLIGVPFVFARKPASAILCIILIVAVSAAWRISRLGKPQRSLKIFSAIAWLVLVALLYLGVPPITVPIALAVAVMLCIVVNLRAGAIFVGSYMLAWGLYLVLGAWDLAPRSYFLGGPVVGWFISAFAVWLVLLPIPGLVRHLRSSLSLQQATIEATADGILVINNLGAVEIYNQRFVDMWRIPLAALASGQDADLLNAVLGQIDDPETFLRRVRDLYDHPEQSSFDSLKLKDGRIYERNSLPQRMEGKVVGRVWSFRDVSERQQTEETLRKSRRLLDSIVENIPAMVFVKRADDLRFELFNKAGELLLGHPRENFLGKNDHDFFPIDQADRFTEKDRIVLGTSEVIEIVQEPITTASGEIRYLHTRKFALRDDAGEPTHLLGISLDITDRKLIEKELRVLATAFNSQEALMITDANSVILRVNPAFTESTGYASEEVMGKNPRLLNSGHHGAAFYAGMWGSIARTGVWKGEIWNRRKNGEIYPNWMTITAVKGADGVVTHYVGSQTDITSRKSAEEEIKHLAFYDPLTQLPNRRLLMDRLRRGLVSSSSSGRDGALMFIDMDNFKMLNDTMGHDNGDALLRQVAERLPWCLRDGDTVARLGGDEFVVMLEELSEDPLEAAAQAEAVGEKIIAALNQPYNLVGHQYRCTPSIGVALFADHKNTLDEVMKRADLAMYQAKAAGRNCLRFYNPEMQAVVTAQAAMEEELRRALDEKHFVVYYQAQTDHLGRWIGAEALVRWVHPARGLVSPAEFIPLAEQTGLILPLGYWVLDTACAQLAAWALDPKTAHLSLAVNVSARQFRSPDFSPKVLASLEQTGANPKRLKLELTESLLLEDVEDTIMKMVALKALGVGFSLDDFGTGYSSLTYLKRLPIDQLKIDRSFVRDILTDPNDAAISRTIVALGQNLGMSVIAEGVETEAQWNFLSGLGCHSYQGYYFGYPMPIKEFDANGNFDG